MVAMVLLMASRCVPAPADPTSDPEGCANACENLRDLGCEEGEPTDAGASCEDVCLNGMNELYDLPCLAEVLYCDLDPCVIP